MMKKYFLMLVMLFTVSVNSFGEDNSTNEMQRINSYSININTKQLSRYLGLSKDQIESIEAIENEFSKDMMFAAIECNDINRSAVTKNAIEKNIKHVSYILNNEQYHKYLKVLNATLHNRGLLK